MQRKAWKGEKEKKEEPMSNNDGGGKRYSKRE